MKRALFTLAVLFLTGAALTADDRKQAGDPATKPVVVDPVDLRQPVADPEKELSEKYNGRLVLFTGHVQKTGQDAQTKAVWYSLQTEIPKVSTKAKKNANAKKPAAEPTDVVVVKVYLQKEDKRLRAAPARLAVTVVGQGEITAEGALIIRDAEVRDLPKQPQR